MKRILFKLILLLCCNIIIFSNIVFADDIDTEEYSSNIIDKNLLETSSSTFPDINSRAYIVLDRITGCILLGKNEHTKRKMASTTKIMTATVILENCNLDEIVEISKKAASTGGSRLGLKTGDKITIRDLLYGLMLCSGNDAAVALAEAASGSISNFANLMNEKAKSLNLTNTHFITPHGLDENEHYTTAYELAILTDYALKNSTFLNIVGTKTYTITINNLSKTINNTNELLGYLNGVYGVKTGFTNGANRCLVSSCKRGNMDIICIVLGADTKKFRTQDSIKLIEYTFKTFSYINIEEQIESKITSLKEEINDNFIVQKGKSQNVEFSFVPLANNLFPIENNLITKLKIHANINTNLIAPIEKRTVIGSISVYIDEKFLLSTNIIVDNYILKKDFITYFYDYIKNYTQSLNSFLK